jgi:hypothetical protein
MMAMLLPASRGEQDHELSRNVHDFAGGAEQSIPLRQRG